MFCAPSLTAAVDQLSHLVPESVRGEAMGWHSAAMTTGVALGSPLAGVAVDTVGWRGAFGVVAGAGLALTALCLALSRRTPRPRVADGGHDRQPGNPRRSLTLICQTRFP